jgi:hypothetical protein
VDLPEELHALAVAQAGDPPAVPLAEWVRRLIAWKVGYDLPPLAERRKSRVRLTGEPKLKSGRKPGAA